jgi:chromosome segregation ATPase
MGALTWAEKEDVKSVSLLRAFVSGVTKMDESNQHSSAYSSLANSTTEIHEKGDGGTDITSAKEDMKKQQRPNSYDGPVEMQMRTITEDYNALLRRATEQIKALTREKFELGDQCEKLMTMNEDVTAELTNLVKRDSRIKAENVNVIKANEELFEEAQRLNDEEERWANERERFEVEIRALKKQVESLDEKVGSEVQGVSERLKEEGRRRLADAEREMRALEEANHDLERRVGRLTATVRDLEAEKDSLQSRKEGVSGENMQLMLDAKEQERQFRTKTAALQAQLQKAEDKCKRVEKENARLAREKVTTTAAAAPVVIAAAAAPPSNDKRFRDLVEQNKNLTDWREQLIGKNKQLTEDNEKLKAKCTNLEDLLHEEETDINDVLELIKSMQGGGGGSPDRANPVIGPISKFRDLQRLKKN